MSSQKRDNNKLKKTVEEKYAQISEQSKSANKTSCCGSGCGCDTVDYAIFADDYSSLDGYNEDADLGLGCGLPTEYAQISKGDTVVDLGSGAGNDCFVARELVGKKGRVIGLDMTEKMIEKANENVEKLGFENVEFVLGDIEDMPLEDSVADVVISNCVLNLVPDKQKAFAETHRILKRGAHFSISDIVTSGDLPKGLKEDAEMYAGCVSGAIPREEYFEIVKGAGFENLKVQKEKEINIPDEILAKHLSASDLNESRNSEVGIYSITLYAEKPV